MDTGAGISVPVGPGTLGRILNVIGEPVDERGPVPHDKTYPIHREAPPFEEQATSAEILVTGIKVVDLLAPYLKGGKVGLFGGAGVGKTVLAGAAGLLAVEAYHDSTLRLSIFQAGTDAQVKALKVKPPLASVVAVAG